MAGQRFPILIELEPEASIQTLAALHNLPGIAKIHFDFDQFNKPKPPRAKPDPAPPQVPGTPPQRSPDAFGPMRAVVDLLIKADRPMKLAEIRAAENGQRMVNVVAALVKNGRVRQTAPATYTITAQGTRWREAAKAEARSVKKKANGAGTHEARPQTAAELILDMLRTAGGAISRKQFGEAFVADGRSAGSVGDQLGKLVKAKKIRPATDEEKVGRGSYVLT